VGKVSYFRVIEGPIQAGDNRLVVTRTGVEERMTTLMVPRGKEQSVVPMLHVGDIGVVTKLTSALTGDTLHDKQHDMSLPLINFPNPLFAVAVHPKSKNDTAKLSPSLTRLCEEDPSLRWLNDPVTHETVLLGMGQSHIEVAVHHLHNKFGVDVEMSTPKVPYRETITKSGQSRYRHKKQTGGAGQFAEIEMSIEPSAPGEGYVFSWKVFGGTISSSYQTSIEKGIKQVMENGVIAGYQVYDVKCVVLDGKEHAVDSKPIAFEIAARNVFREAFNKASPVLLEPLYRFTVTVPENAAGDVMGNLKTKRAQVVGMDQEGNKTIIIADAPLAEMQRYSTDLRSITQGRGRYTMEFLNYTPMPSHLAAVIIAKHKEEAKHEEE
jgi:elongation factor G